MAKRRKIEPGEYRIPDFIRVDGDRWCIATRATVAAWRKARQVGMTDDAKHTLLQYRAATQLLELAQEHDLPDDAGDCDTARCNQRRRSHQRRSRHCRRCRWHLAK